MTSRLTGRERTLLRAPSWLGDFVAAEPALRALVHHTERAGAPGAVALAAPARLLELLDGRFPNVHREGFGPGRPETASAYAGRDVALLLNGSWRSARHAWRAGVPVRAGLAGGGRRAWLTHPFVPAREAGAAALGRGRSGGPVRRLPRPFVSVCIEVLGWLGVAVPERRPRLLVTDRAREASGALLAAAGLAPGEPYLLANAASRPGSAKGVPPASFAAALDAIARATDLPVVVAGAPGEEGPAREIAERAVVARTVLLDAPAPGVAELAALAGAARLAVGPDNGARHVAEALATPCVVLCGPTDPRHTSEHAATTRILRVEVPCGPCHRERCPLAGERKHACMTGIEPSAIAAAAAELLG